MLELINSHGGKALAEQIMAGQKHIENIKQNEILILQELVANLPLEHACALTQKAVLPLVPAYCGRELHPSWFDTSTEFLDNIWGIKLGTWEKSINFNVVLNDGEKLTAEKHRPLLNSFKKWLVMQGQPFYNGGKILKNASIRDQLLRVLQLIDVMLLNAEKIDLAGRHLTAVNSDLVLDILVNLSTGVSNGLYSFKKHLTSYLLDNIPTISNEEVQIFVEMYPYVSQPLLPELIDLPLTQAQRIRACCFLFKQGVYQNGGATRPLPNGAFFSSIFYANTLFKDLIRIKPINMLRIKEVVNNTEYPSIPVTDSENDGVSTKYLLKYLSSFKMLGVLKGEEFSEIPVSTFECISVKRVSEHIIVRATGRFTTLPVPIVFAAIKNSFEFCVKYTDDILEAAYNLVLIQSKKENTGKSIVNDDSEKGFQNYLPDSLQSLGVTQWFVSGKEDNCFSLRRRNTGFCDLFEVLIGSIQVLVGATMARRQGELLDLHPTDCLLPSRSDPNQKSSHSIDYEMIFDNRKSGSGGENAMLETLAKPILRRVAGLIYKLQCFNEKLIKQRLIKQNEASLFLYLDHQRVEFKSIKQHTYNQHLDAFCDYFETEVVQYEKNCVRRYYIRQHQLRRFFAMLFFWSKGFDGLDTLRHFLAHTDTEHLYHYVTEGISGEVLTDIKAKRILDGVGKKDIENIDKLTSVILEKFGVQSVTFKTYKQVLEDYKEDIFDGFIETFPPFEQIEQQFEQELICFEQDISRLLLDHTIDLEPEFFTVIDSKGKSITDYKLVLKVRELDDD